ncbi:hypothetical protein H8957_017473, partial [Semnopithecus entellus]
KSSEELQCLKQMEEELLFLKGGQGSQMAGLIPPPATGSPGALWNMVHRTPASAVGMPPNCNSSTLSLSSERTILSSGGWSGHLSVCISPANLGAPELLSGSNPSSILSQGFSYLHPLPTMALQMPLRYICFGPMSFGAPKSARK